MCASVRACVRLTGQFRVLMDRRNQPGWLDSENKNRPGRSDFENGNRPGQSDSENENPGLDDWCAASFVKTKRRKSQGEFSLLLNKSDQETEISRRVSTATEQIQPWFFDWFFWWLSLSGSLKAAETEEEIILMINELLQKLQRINLIYEETKRIDLRVNDCCSRN